MMADPVTFEFAHPWTDPETGTSYDVDTPVQLDAGQATRLAAAGYGRQLPGVPADDAPAQAARKEEWVEHAVTHGAERADAEQLTKPELIERYGGQ